MKASKCDLFLVEAWREGQSRGVSLAKYMDRVPNMVQFTASLWWSCEFVRRASAYSLEMTRFVGGLWAQIEILEVSTRVWV